MAYREVTSSIRLVGGQSYTNPVAANPKLEPRVEESLAVRRRSNEAQTLRPTLLPKSNRCTDCTHNECTDCTRNGLHRWNKCALDGIE